jgi:hypothetical protein
VRILRRASGACVLNAERTTTARYWDGNLDHFTTRASCKPGTLAAMVVAEDGQARAWMNLDHCRQRDWPWIWMRLQAASLRHACTLVWASDLAVLVSDDDREEAQGA